MAELGTINFVDVNAGTSRIDRSGETQALAQVLSAGKKITDEAIKGSVTKDMNEAIDASEAERGDTTPSSQPEQTQQGGENLAVYPEGSREAHLSTTIDRLNRVIEQGNTSQRQLAEMRVKKIMGEAQDRFPWLYEDLQSRAGAVLSGSVQLDQLELEDAARTDAASSATKQVQSILDHARRKWDDGGLGMDPSIQHTNPAFVAQYSDRQRLRETSERAARVTGMLLANDTLDAAEIASEVNGLLSGQWSLSRAKTMQVFDDHGINAMLTEIQKGDSANLAIISEAQNVGIPNALAELEIAKNELNLLFTDSISPRLANTPHFAETKKRHEDTIAQIDSMINRLGAISQQVPDTPTLIKEMNAIRAYDFGRAQPEPFQTFMAWAGSPAGELVINLAAESKTAEGITLRDHLASMNVSVLGQLYPDMYGGSPTPEDSRTLAYVTSGSYEIMPSHTPQDINRKIDSRFRDSENPWVVPTKGNTQELDASTKSFINWDQLWAKSPSDIPEMASEQFAGEYLTGLNTSLRAYNVISDKPEDVEAIVLQGLASPGLTRAVDIAGDGNSRGQRLAFGESAKEYYVNTNPQARRQEVKSTYLGAHIDRFPLYELAAVDIDRMTTGGDFVYVIDEKKVGEIAQQRQMTQFGSRVPARGIDTIKERVRREVIQMMDPIVAEVTQQMQIEQNLMRANAPSADKRTRSDVNLEFYLGENDPGQSLPWVDIFRHTSETE